MWMKLRYTRLLIKFSGEQLAGPKGTGFDARVAAQIAREVAQAVALGVECAVVVGGGNYVRGNQVAGGGIADVTAHNMGMLATVINAIAVRDIFNANSVPAVALTTLEVNQVADLYTYRRAIHQLSKGRVVILGGGVGRPFLTTDTATVNLGIELGCDAICKVTKVDGVYTKDPAAFADAKRLDAITFAQALEDPAIKVMDKAAIGLAMENNQPIVVCDLATPGNVKRLVLGESVGTLIS